MVRHDKGRKRNCRPSHFLWTRLSQEEKPLSPLNLHVYTLVTSTMEWWSLLNTDCREKGDQRKIRLFHSHQIAHKTKDGAQIHIHSNIDLGYKTGQAWERSQTMSGKGIGNSSYWRTNNQQWRVKEHLRKRWSTISRPWLHKTQRKSLAILSLDYLSLVRTQFLKTNHEK